MFMINNHDSHCQLLQTKRAALERGIYRGLKLIDKTLKKVERIIEKFLSQQMDINGMQFGFMAG